MRESLTTAPFITAVQIHDSNLYTIECPKKHHSLVVLQQSKFELLFEIGANAIFDGYYREAVSSFASSLECFYEFFVQAFLLQNKHSQADINSCWKHVSRQSERQLGAYIIIHMHASGKIPKMLNTDDTKFRNEVVHRGRIPSRSEAIAYGQQVLEILRSAIGTAKEKFPDGVQQQILRRIRDAYQRAEPGLPSGSTSIATIISVDSADQTFHAQSLEEALKNVNIRKLFEGSGLLHKFD